MFRFFPELRDYMCIKNEIILIKPNQYNGDVLSRTVNVPEYLTEIPLRTMGVKDVLNNNTLQFDTSVEVFDKDFDNELFDRLCAMYTGREDKELAIIKPILGTSNFQYFEIKAHELSEHLNNINYDVKIQIITAACPRMLNVIMSDNYNGNIMDYLTKFSTHSKIHKSAYKVMYSSTFGIDYIKSIGNGDYGHLITEDFMYSNIRTISSSKIDELVQLYPLEKDKFGFEYFDSIDILKNFEECMDTKITTEESLQKAIGSYMLGIAAGEYPLVIPYLNDMALINEHPVTWSPQMFLDEILKKTLKEGNCRIYCFMYA